VRRAVVSQSRRFGLSGGLHLAVGLVVRLGAEPSDDYRPLGGFEAVFASSPAPMRPSGARPYRGSVTASRRRRFAQVLRSRSGGRLLELERQAVGR
jgi:hypothetical protein